MKRTSLPQVTDTLAQSRAWATVSVPSAGVPNIVTIASLAKQVGVPRLASLTPLLRPD